MSGKSANRRGKPAPALDDPGDCLCSSLRRATRAITQAYDEALAAHGLTSTQFCVLVAIEKSMPVPMKKLAAQLGMDRTTLTRLLAPLAKGRLTRDAGSEDGRERLIELTPSGAARLKAARPAWLKAQRQVTSAFGEIRSLDLLGELEDVRTVTTASRS